MFDYLHKGSKQISEAIWKLFVAIKKSLLDYAVKFQFHWIIRIALTILALATQEQSLNTNVAHCSIH